MPALRSLPRARGSQYSFRLLFLLFLSNDAGYKTSLTHAHDANLIMRIPLIYCLAFGSIFYAHAQEPPGSGHHMHGRVPTSASAPAASAGMKKSPCTGMARRRCLSAAAAAASVMAAPACTSFSVGVGPGPPCAPGPPPLPARPLPPPRTTCASSGTCPRTSQSTCTSQRTPSGLLVQVYTFTSPADCS